MKIILFFILTHFAVSIFAQRADLTIDFLLEEAEGDLLIRLTDNESNIVETVIVPVHANRTQYTFQQLDIEKSYAVAVFQDLNGNRELDTYFTKIPKEPYGFSNDVRGGLNGAPTLEDQLITINKDQRISITVE